MCERGPSGLVVKLVRNKDIAHATQAEQGRRLTYWASNDSAAPGKQKTTILLLVDTDH
jgi:hypothetical protein